jgi:hypothetical protein
MVLIFLALFAPAAASAVHAPPPQAGEASWPRGPKLACRWAASSSTLDLIWDVAVALPPVALSADLYEVQISDSPFARAFAVHTVSGTNASLGLDVLLPGTTYYLSARAHAGWAFETGHLMGAGTWGQLGPSVACTTGAYSGPSRSDRQQQGANDRLPSFFFESWRLSEYSSEVDYLLNHDGADPGGSSLLLTALSQFEAVGGSGLLKSSWLGGSTSEVVLTT